MRRREFLFTSSILTASALPISGFAGNAETTMRRLTVFNNLSIDGYFTDASGDMSWAHSQDPQWLEFTSQNASGDADLVFGRVTYELMASFWPTPQAMQIAPTVAESMNRMRKTVFSRTLKSAHWNNTHVLSGNLMSEMHRLKQEEGPDLLIMGSGQIVTQLTQAGLIDEYQLVITPHALGRGRTLFEGIERRHFRLTNSRSFSNGNVVVRYAPT